MYVLFDKDIFKVIILKKVFNSKKVLSSTQIFNFYFIDKIHECKTENISKKI